MKKRLLSLLLALAICLSLAPAEAAAEANLPDWYFLFAIFKSVDADCRDRDGKMQRAVYTMTQDEIDMIREDARDFEAFMNQVGVMRAHIEVVEIDETLTELENYSDGGYLSPKQAAPLLKGAVDLDRYDHIVCVASLNVDTSYLGRGGSSYESGAGHAGFNLRNREYCMNVLRRTEVTFPPSAYVHEFLHFMEVMTKKWGAEFGLHDIRINHYSPDDDNGRECYTDILLNRARGAAGTGVSPAVWQYPPHVLRTVTELRIPSGAAGLARGAFENHPTITHVTVPGSAAAVGVNAFQGCPKLTEATLFSGVSEIGNWAFGNCSALTRVSLPASVTSVGYAAFWNTGVQEVYYGGTEAQWKAMQIGEYNEELTRANIRYNSLLADVRTADWFAQPVAWALQQGIAAGTGNGGFSPNASCTVAQIITFLWRAAGSPKPSGGNPFSDVKRSDYYADAAAWASEKGLVSGKTFGGERPCTRSMAAAYLWKAAGSPSAPAAGFADVAAGADYAGAVAWAVEEGVTAGTSPTTFSPDSVCTRGQIVTFLYRWLAA